MKQFLLGVLFLATAAIAHAQSEFSLDEIASPAEIGAEMRSMHPEYFVEDFSNPNMIFNVANPRIKILINKAKQNTSESAQTMWVYVDGELQYVWPVSTGREKQEVGAGSGRKYFSRTPTGTWTPYGLSRYHKSKLWDADMPRAIWLTGGIAIHAASRSYEKRLGERASGGCIRLQFENADLLFSMVEEVGRKNVQVTIFDK